MNGERLSAAGLEDFEKALAGAVDNARSLDEIDAWLDANPFVRSVQRADYLLKSNPPQRDIVVDLAMADGTTARRVVNVFSLGDGRFRFRQLRDER